MTKSNMTTTTRVSDHDIAMGRYKYEPIGVTAALAGMQWHVPGWAQGQIVTYAFAAPGCIDAGRGDPFMRVTDASVGPNAHRYYRLVKVSR